MNLKNKNKGVKMKCLIIVLFVSSFSYSALGRCGSGTRCLTGSNPDLCQLWRGIWEKNTDNKKVCVFPKFNYYCPKYIEEPIIVKSNGKKYCVARIKCQEANRKGSPFTASVTCRATDNNECPSPTICAQDKQKQVEVTGYTAKILKVEDISR